MSETAILWLFGIVFTIQFAIASWILNHSRDCRDFRISSTKSLTQIKTRLGIMEDD